jgi:hypothetical protein
MRSPVIGHFFDASGIGHLIDRCIMGKAAIPVACDIRKINHKVDK